MSFTHKKACLTYSSVYGKGCITPPVALEQISDVSEKETGDSTTCGDHVAL